ncbi:hypothetical protein T12_3752 [Trichinella patagoniensis]|uniref:Uncharacterized protein n=1 Tax=Trichinella patagoniensis TaxID=990121 RepID=A0A0V0Z018_9BILA|nr:hypothetical protein T12_3752 [Trichinella patagoniensis]
MLGYGCGEYSQKHTLDAVDVSHWFSSLHPSWSLNAVLCYALALRGALYALHVLINVAWLRYQ